MRPYLFVFFLNSLDNNDVTEVGRNFPKFVGQGSFGTTEIGRNFPKFVGQGSFGTTEIGRNFPKFVGQGSFGTGVTTAFNHFTGTEKE